MQWKPNVTVAAIIKHDDRYLLVEEQSADGTLVFNQPAGHLESGESLITAVKREVLEETAWQFEPTSLVGVYLNPDRRSGLTYLRFCFYGLVSNHDALRKLDNGIVRAVWFSLEQMQQKADKMRSPLVMKCLYDYLSGKSYPLEILNNPLPEHDL